MRTSPWLLLPALALLALAPGRVRAEEAPDAPVETAEEPAVYEIGDAVEDFAGLDPHGEEIRLSDLAITRARAEAAVLDLAREHGAEEDVALGLAISALPDLQDEEGEVDPFLLEEFLGRAGQPFGLLPPATLAEEAATLADVAAWIAAAEKSPIVVMVWSPRCPMCKSVYDERIAEILAEEGARLLAVASNTPDSSDHVRLYLEGLGWAWRVVMDPEQTITDRFGGERTPHLFVLDAEGTLRYRGAVDNDPRYTLEDEEREEYLRDALDAIRAGETVEVDTTEPAG